MSDQTASRNALLKMLSGSFSNQQQAFDNPPLYAHILVRFRPAPQLAPGSLLLEQAYAIAPNEPYRIRVLRPWICPERGLVILNFNIKDGQRFGGAVEDPKRILEIKEDDLSLLEGCTYLVSTADNGFEGTVEPGCRCLVKRKDRTTYLVSSFVLHPEGMETIDRGYDPDTHEHLWGSIAGAFRFTRTGNWSEEIPEHWLH